jgi:hypothetical protein
MATTSPGERGTSGTIYKQRRLLFEKGARVMRARQEKMTQLNKEDLIVILLVIGTILLAIWTGKQIL